MNTELNASESLSFSPPVLRVAAIHDLSGFGRSSLTIVIPTLSTMGMQVCPLPTAVLSSQTAGMSNFTFFDLTEQMEEILNHWQSVNMAFDAVYSGFLGSAQQAELVAECMHNQLKPEGIFLVDPVLGDDGELYPTQTEEIVHAMRKLVCLADIVTPNYTEACLLLGEKYDEKIDKAQLKGYLQRLACLECEKPPHNLLNEKSHYINQETQRKSQQKTVIITGVPSPIFSTTSPTQNTYHKDENEIFIVAYEKERDRFWKIKNPKIPASYPGTGDTFASVLLGALLQKDSVPLAVARASRFVYEAILVTHGYDLPVYEGILLEKVLPSLKKQEIWEYEVF